MVGGKFDWDTLKVFQAVAEEGSINAAVKSLGLSYGKVSKDLEELERALKRRLFDRSNRGLQLTPVGEEILRAARAMNDTVRSISDGADERDPDELVICAREGIATYWLARKLPELLAIEPNVRILIKVMPTTPNLIEGDGDIAIQFEKPTATNIFSRQLGWMHYILYASPEYIASNGEPRSMSDLQGHRCLRLQGEEYQTELWRRTAVAWGDILPRSVATDTGTVLLEACASGAGVAVMPSYVSEFEDRVSPLTAIKPLSTVRFWVAFTERVRNMEASHTVLHWIKTCFDPSANPCFREHYVQPAHRLMQVANDVAPAATHDDAGDDTAADHFERSRSRQAVADAPVKSRLQASDRA